MHERLCGSCSDLIYDDRTKVGSPEDSAYAQRAFGQEVGRCLDRLEGTGERGGKAFTALGRCCGLMSQGHDVLAIEAEFDRLDGEIKSELQELVKATALHAYANRAAGVLKDASSRAFWDRHFKDARSVAADELLEAMRFDAGEAVDMDALDPLVRLALGRH